MSSLIRFTRAIERLNNFFGHTLCWCAGIMAALVVAIVVARTFFNLGSMAAQESVTYLHATLFMLCLAYAAGTGSHVRVDIFYHRFSPLGQAWVNVIGASLFLLPFAVFLLTISWQFTANSWAIAEASINPGGIPAVYLLKTLIPVSACLLVLRALGEIIECVLIITYVHPDNRLITGRPAVHTFPSNQSD